MFEQYGDVVTVKELCQMLQIGRNTAYDRDTFRQNPRRHGGRKIRIRKSDIIRFFAVSNKKTNRQNLDQLSLF